MALCVISYLCPLDRLPVCDARHAGHKQRGEHRQQPITKTKLQLLFHRAWGRVSRVCTFGVNGHDCVMWLIVR